jgi:ribose transport system ATP-binding protein
VGAQLLKLEGIGKSFAGTRVLKDVSFDLVAGEVHILAGENGAGKSTLIKILAGIHTEYEGQLWLRGEPARFTSPQDASQRGISIIHQELSLIDSMSVTENIFLGREKTWKGSLGQWLKPVEQVAQAAALCRRVGLEIDVTRKVEEFSLAVKNCIEIAKALAFQADATASACAGNSGLARILIMDEPTSALNAPEAERLFGLIDELRSSGFGIIYISHKMEEIYRLADRITVLRDGGYVGTAKASELPQAELIRWMIGREMSEQFPKRKQPLEPDAQVRLEVRGLKAPKVHDVSFEVRRGEVLGIAGLQGSGNSELLNAIFGTYGDAATGTVVIDGKRIEIRSPARSIQEGLALLTNDRKATGLVLRMGIRENITLASLPRSSTLGVVRGGAENERAREQQKRLSIRASSLEQETGTLSGGNQQKVALAKWLETRPKVLFLDEPTRGVDVGAKHEIYELIHELTTLGYAIVVITSEMPELLALSDRILVMHRGQVSAEFTREQATQENIIEAAMGRSVRAPQKEVS